MSPAGPVIARVPGDKSITHRALILSALAEGESRLSGLLDAADTRSTAAVLRALGVDAPTGRLGEAVLRGRGLGGLTAPAVPLDCGNSGTTARLMLGVLAGSVRATATGAVLDGDASLRGRPMRRVTDPLRTMGASFDELGEPDRLPIRVRGARPLDALDYTSPRASAQAKTALLLAGLVGGARVRVTEPVLSRDHTERMLASMGAPMTTATTDAGHTAALEPVNRLDPIELDVPADISSAVYFLALAGLLGAAGPAAAVRVPGVGLNPGRDGALAVLRRMGVEVDVENEDVRAGEPVGDVVARAGADGTEGGIRPVDVASHEIPALIDEVPMLAVMAAMAPGESRFDGVAELRVKESDRVNAVSGNLRSLGIETDTGPDHLVVLGRPGRLRGTVDASGDHRIAMAFGVLGAVPGNEIEIIGREATDISFPGFWRELDRVRRELQTT